MIFSSFALDTALSLAYHRPFVVAQGLEDGDVSTFKNVAISIDVEANDSSTQERSV